MSYLPMLVFCIFLFIKASFCTSLDLDAATFEEDPANFLGTKPIAENIINLTDRQNVDVQEVLVEGNFYPFNGKVIFDRSRDSVELPLSLYHHLIKQLSSLSGMSCNEEMDHPMCFVQNQEISNLSAILIVGASDQIILGPKVYIQEKKLTNSTHTWITLNLKALADEDHIFLGQTIMGHYHLVLNQTSKVEHIYQRVPQLLIADTNPVIFFVIGFCIALVVCLAKSCKRHCVDPAPAEVIVQPNLAANYVPPQQIQPNMIQYNPPGAQNEGMGQYRYAPLPERSAPDALNLSDEERARMQLSNNDNEYGGNYYARS